MPKWIFQKTSGDQQGGLYISLPVMVISHVLHVILLQFADSRMINIKFQSYQTANFNTAAMVSVWFT